MARGKSLTVEDGEEKEERKVTLKTLAEELSMIKKRQEEILDLIKENQALKKMCEEHDKKM